MLRDIDESKLSYMDRLGLAYCRLNRYEWDDIIGPKPEGFDDLPSHIARDRRPRGVSKKVCSKSDYVAPPIRAIKSIIGEANCSRCWWIFILGKTDMEWFQWYMHSRFSE